MTLVGVSEPGAAVRRLSIRQGNSDYHLFQHFDPAYVDLRPADVDGCTDLIVLPCNRSLDIIDEPDPFPAERWDDAATRIVFDASGEGKPHDPGTTERLHALLRRRGAPLDRAVYLTQDRHYASDYAAYCAAQGIGPRMQVVNYDYWIRRFLSTIEVEGEKLLAKRLRNFHRRPRRRDRRFMALAFTPRPTKVLFLLRLLKNERWDQGYISFGGFEQLAKHRGRQVWHFEKDVRALQGFEDLAEDVLKGMPALQSKGLMTFGEPADRPYEFFLKRLPQDMALVEYDASWFSVILETEMLDRPCRITEKPLKAMCNLHPAIILGNPGSLSLLRDLGFATFDGLFDERYDEEDDPRRRFDMVWTEVERLCGMDEADLDRLEAAMEETLVFNARWGLTKLPTIWRRDVDARLLNAITTPGPDVDVVSRG